MRLNFLLNWRLNPYHAPILVAKELGFYQDYDIELSILEPTNPSDVTKIIGDNQISLGLKAMVHCYAARSRGYPIQSIGTLLDEPPTGLISLQTKAIQTLSDLKGKRVGYVGEFGKIMVDQLAIEAGLDVSDYQSIRVGMDGAAAILQDHVDATLGIGCFQQLEIEQHGYLTDLLRIDELARLGCCCFCSILFIANQQLLDTEPDVVRNFMTASKKGAQITREQPDKAFECFIQSHRSHNTDLNKKIFYHALPFISRDLQNIDRDWEKVSCYAKKIKIIDPDYDYKTCFTNDFLNSI